MANSKRVLILWADRASANLGVRVLAEGSARLVRQVLGEDTEVTFQDFRGSETGVSLEKSSLLRELRRPSGPVHDLIRRHDIVWDTGAGDSFTDIYGNGRLARMVIVQRMVQKLGLPIVMGPQTIGPFKKLPGRTLAASRLRRMDLIVARDPISLGVARKLAPKTSSTLSTDVVFALPVPSIPKSRDVILNVSGLLWGENSHVDSETYRRLVRRLLRDLIDAGRTPSILAHVLDNPYPDNDVPAATEIAAEFGVELLVPDDLGQARQMIASGNVLVGSRMHACLNAISVGVPTVPWAYSRKFAPLFAQLGWERVIDLHSSSPIAVDRTVGETREALDAITVSEVEAVRAAADRVLDSTREQLRESIGK